MAPPEQLESIETTTPTPKEHEVLVDIKAAGVGFVDGLLVQGLYQVKPPLPYFPGSEFAGVICELGPSVENAAIGDRVLGLAAAGAFADALTIDARKLIHIPDQLDDETAAGFFINYATALYGLKDCGALCAGETVLVLGAAGGVGSAAICVAKAMGALVIAGASSVEKRDAAIGFGADEVLDYTQPDWRRDLKALCAQRNLDLVYDPVGGDLSEPAFRSLSPGGRFLVVGFASGKIANLPLNLARLKRSSIVGVDWGGAARASPTINQELMQTLMQWIVQGKLKTASVSVRPMHDFRSALQDQLAGKIVGKLVLSNSE